VKLFKQPKLNFRPLDTRGIAHLFIPLLAVILVAVVGTYLVVAGYANAADKGGPAGGKPLSDSNPPCTSQNKCDISLRVLSKASYNKEGKKVVAGIVDFKAVKIEGEKSIPINLKKSQYCTNKGHNAVTTKTSSMAFGDGWHANVAYVKKGTKNQDGSKTQIGACFAHLNMNNPAQDAVGLRLDSTYSGNNYLKGSSSYSFVTLAAQDGQIRFHPQPKDKAGKAIHPFLTVRLPGGLSHDQCFQPNKKGVEVKVTITPSPAAAKEIIAAQTVNLKYVVPKHGSPNPSHYCSARFNMPKVKKGVSYTITAELKGKDTYFLKAGQRTIVFPKAADNGNQGGSGNSGDGGTGDNSGTGDPEPVPVCPSGQIAETDDSTGVTTCVADCPPDQTNDENDMTKCVPIVDNGND
jgi:hypothetical protein